MTERGIVSRRLIDILFVAQVLANVAAITFLVVIVWQTNHAVAMNQQSQLRTARAVTRCALVEELKVNEAVAKSLGLHRVANQIQYPDVTGVDCDEILKSVLPP